MVDALIQNPFGEDVVKNTTLQDIVSDFHAEQVDTKRAPSRYFARQKLARTARAPNKLTKEYTGHH